MPSPARSGRRTGWSCASRAGIAPANGKGTVCVFTGRSEFIEKYFETVRDLRRRGFAVATMDWRGQGHSSRQLPDPRKGHVESFSDFEIDVETFMQRVVLPDCPPPYFALAHSMGGAVMLRVAHSGKRWFERMVLAAPLIDLPYARSSLLLRILMRTLRLAGFGGELRSRQQRRSDAGIGLCRQSADLRSRALRAQRRDSRAGSSARNWFADGGMARCGVRNDHRVSRRGLPVANRSADTDGGGGCRYRRIGSGHRGICRAAAGGIASA